MRGRRRRCELRRGEEERTGVVSVVIAKCSIRRRWSHVDPHRVTRAPSPPSASSACQPSRSPLSARRATPTPSPFARTQTENESSHAAAMSLTTRRSRRDGTGRALQSTHGGLTEKGAIEGVGILDCLWRPLIGSEENKTPLLLAAATSACDGRLYPVSIDADGAPSISDACATMACADAGDACMGLDWSADAARIALTGTSGKAYVGDAAADGALRLVTEWQAHDLECWCAAFDPLDVNCLYTGADDAMLKRWDLRCDNDESEPASTACNRRTHRAGVCCISPSRKREHIRSTGSYDEAARLWDARRWRSRCASSSAVAASGGSSGIRAADCYYRACTPGLPCCASQRRREQSPSCSDDTRRTAWVKAGYGADWSREDGLLAATCSSTIGSCTPGSIQRRREVRRICSTGARDASQNPSLRRRTADRSGSALRPSARVHHSASSYMLKRGNSGGINQVRRPHATPFFSCTLSLSLPSTHAQTGSAGGAGRVAACRAQIGA